MASKMKEVNKISKAKHKEYKKTGWLDDGMGSRFIPKQYRNN